MSAWRFAEPASFACTLCTVLTVQTDAGWKATPTVLSNFTWHACQWGNLYNMPGLPWWLYQMQPKVTLFLPQSTGPWWSLSTSRQYIKCIACRGRALVHPRSNAVSASHTDICSTSVSFQMSSRPYMTVSIVNPTSWACDNTVPADCFCYTCMHARMLTILGS